jgi:transglutaminase-like putative cysteine protease
VDALVSIGDFSARSGLSLKMLRTYAAIGLLTPAAIDKSSGYRYYDPSQVEVAKTIALLRSAGVCQDFAHLTLVLLRHLGIPARYVSGNVHPEATAPTGVTVTGTSHAWVEAWLGGWHPLDPTSGTPVGELHVTVGTGRDYRDVAPFLGVYHGGTLEELIVDVELTRVA